MARTTFVFFFVLIFLVSIVLLQVWLSKREGKWPGLLLPIVSFLISFIYPLNMAIPSVEGFFVALILGWLLANIPTIVFTVIYLSCREKLRRSKQLNKMFIQDLD